MKVYAGSSSLDLAIKISEELGAELGKVEISKFPNGEKRVVVKDDEVGKKAVLVQSLSLPVDENIVEMALMADALKRMARLDPLRREASSARLGVEELVGVVPWMGYGKQDKVFQSGEPLSAQVVARILDTCGFSKIVTVDLHNSETIKLFSTPVVELSARPVLVEYFRDGLRGDEVVVAPDVGAVESARKMAEELGVEIVQVEKRRDLVTGEVSVVGVRGDVKEKNVIMLDDNIVTGATLVQVSRELVRLGARSVKIGVTHHNYVEGVQKRIEKCEAISELIVTDSIRKKAEGRKLKVLSVAKMIAGEIG